MRYLNRDDLEALAFGAALLGSGGGGAPSYNLQLTKQLMKEPLPLLSLEELEEDVLVVPVAFMGAPLAALEKMPSGKEFQAIRSVLPEDIVLMPAEIGGANAFTPLWIGALFGLPVVDADTIGRAFPELQMSVCTLHGVSASPTYVADAMGSVVKLELEDPEKAARQLAVKMGARALVALYLMRGSVAKKVCIPGSITRAIELGKQKQFKPLFSGTVVDVDQKIEGGFLKGKAKIRGEGVMELFYRNEYLLARSERVIVESPTILMLLEQETHLPIPTSMLKYGQRVDLITLEPPEVWKTPAGLELIREAL